MNVISISNLISYDVVVSITVASFVLLVAWCILSVRNNNNKKKERDQELFKQPPPAEDCPICFVRLPTFHMGYKSWKMICSGCRYAPVYDNQGNKVDNQKCPFCRTPPPASNEEMITRYKTRKEVKDPIAIYSIGCYYREGIHGYPQDYKKALQYYHRAAELGFSKVYCNIGYAYNRGDGVEVDIEKAIHYYELAAMGGNEVARYNLGVVEIEGNKERALKHWMIAVRDGNTESLKNIKRFYSNGRATKEDYTKALRAYQEYLGEIKSNQRDKAAAADEDYRYY